MKRKAIIVDIDGTISENVTGRPWYGKGAAEGMLEDKPYTDLINLINSYSCDCHIQVLILTGCHQGKELEATKEWLNDNCVFYDEIFARDLRDFSKTAAYKEKVYEENTMMWLWCLKTVTLVSKCLEIKDYQYCNLKILIINMVDYKKIINALDLDRVSLMGVENKKEYDIVTIKGGLNGGGDIFYYLTQIDKIVCELSADKREVWLIKWENDCADDVWYLKLGVKETKRISDIKKSISDFCKNQEDFVMKLLNLAETTSEKFFLIKEIAVHNLLPLASTWMLNKSRGIYTFKFIIKQ